MTTPLRIGIAGLGNVGASVFRLLRANSDILSARTGRDIVVTAVSARDKTRNRGIDLANVAWHDDPRDLANDPNVDLVVELMGGAEGAAFDLVTGALKSGKDVVTANKALLASRAGEILLHLNETSGCIAYEAAVAGGIPVIKSLREGLSANRVQAIYGILNGTCNFILSTMTETGRDFDDVLLEAQQRGYAEADPSFDVDGVDAGHKLSILSGLAFGCTPDVKNIDFKGIRGVSALDISFARELGFRIKLLGIARKTARGIEQSVEPCLVPAANPIAAVGGPLNAVYVDGDFVGKVLLMGAGAGGDATASAVVADIVDIARGHKLPLMGAANDRIGALQPADIREREGSFYLRFKVLDVPGVVADISAILRDDKVSLESVLQRGRDPGQPVQLIMTTHETREADMRHAVDKISALKSVMETPHVMRIEEFKS